MDVVVNVEKDEIPESSKELNWQADFHSNILISLGYEPEHLPSADLIKIYHQLKGNWLIASPVHWEASHNDARLTAAGKTLELSDEESRLWFAAVTDLLQADDFRPVYHDAQTWLFNIDGKPPIQSQSLYSSLHKPLMPIFNALDKRFFWQRLITEMQMYMSSHPLNEKRSGPAINGLWFWGEGTFNFDGQKRILTDDEVLLAHSKGINPLDSSVHFKKNDLLILADPKQIKELELEEKIKKFNLNWYWNNCSYATKKASWWSKIWS